MDDEKQADTDEDVARDLIDFFSRLRPFKFFDLWPGHCVMYPSGDGDGRYHTGTLLYGADMFDGLPIPTIFAVSRAGTNEIDLVRLGKIVP